MARTRSLNDIALGWVREDLGKLLEQLRLQVENIASNPMAGDSSISQTADTAERLMLTFATLQLQGLRQVMAEISNLCARVRDGDVRSRELATSTLMDAMVVVPAYLDRMQAAGVALSSKEAPSQAPGLLQIEELGKDGFGARDDDGGSYWVLADASALGALEVGDLLLAGLSEPTSEAPTSMHRRPAGMVVVLPNDARALIE